MSFPSTRCWRTAARPISARSAPALRDPAPDAELRPLAEDLLAIGLRESDEIAARFPKVQRRVGGYNLDALAPNAPVHNLAHILVGSEGTLGFSTRIELKLWPLLGRRAVGACHFARFYDAMAAAQHIVKLKPIAVELVDRTMIELARGIDMFRPTVDAFVRGAPDAVLLVEFAEEDWDENIRRLRQLEALMGDLGFAWDNSGAKWGGVVEVLDPKLQAAITEVRTAGLNIMMSMKEEGKPISFVEDCAVPLEHLAEYTSRLTDGVREARHPRHLVRPRLGRLPACAPGSQPAARQGQAGHARDRRGGVRVRARNTRAPIPASMATAWCARNSMSRCSASAWCTPSRRSRTASTPAACSIPARSCARRNSTTAPISATAPAITASR